MRRTPLLSLWGKTKVVGSSPPIDCHVCPGLISDLDNHAVEKANLENENTYLRAILSWVSASEPQLGMMIKQFKRGDRSPAAGHRRSGAAVSGDT